MKLLVTLINVIILVLTTIGDVVLLIPKVILITIFRLIVKIIKLFRNSYRKILSQSKLIKNTLLTQIKSTNFKLLRLANRLKPKLKFNFKLKFKIKILYHWFFILCYFCFYSPFAIYFSFKLAQS
jgi:glycerol-3-phosphate O-acyltransferase